MALELKSAFMHEYPETDFADGIGKCIFRIDLHDTSNGRNAAYIIRIIEVGSVYEVNTYWGSKGNKLRFKNAGSFGTKALAIQEANKIASEKKRKGYTEIYQNNPQLLNNEHLDYIGLPSSIPLFPDLMNINKIPDDAYLSNYAFEITNPFRDWRYFHISARKIHIHTINRTYVKSIDMPSGIYDETNISYYGGYILLGYIDNNCNGEVYSIFDIVSADYALQPIYNVHKRPWKQRRAILSFMMSEIFLNQDPYDKDFIFHLNDYTTDEEEKIEWRNQLKNYEMLIIRNIDSLYGDEIQYY